MRYPDGGGLTLQGRARREAVRLQAAELFARGIGAVEVADRLRVSTKSAYAWRREWMCGGTAALVSRGPAGGPCTLTAQQLDSPIVLVWDNLTAHHDAVMQKLIDARSWLTVSRFPTYAPELNPVEGVWARFRQSRWCWSGVDSEECEWSGGFACGRA